MIAYGICILWPTTSEKKTLWLWFIPAFKLDYMEMYERDFKFIDTHWLSQDTLLESNVTCHNVCVCVCVSNCLCVLRHVLIAGRTFSTLGRTARLISCRMESVIAMAMTWDMPNPLFPATEVSTLTKQGFGSCYHTTGHSWNFPNWNLPSVLWQCPGDTLFCPWLNDRW